MHEGQFGVVIAEEATGIVTNEDGVRFSGGPSDEIPVSVFSTINEAQDYARKYLLKRDGFECLIIDFVGKDLGTITQS